jgi:large subunit ribosomal protein L17
VAPTASRRARVAKSRQAAAAKDAVDETVDTGATEDELLETDAVETDASDTEAIETGEVESAEVDDDTDEDTADQDTADEVDDEAPYGPGSHAALEDDEQPEGFAIKGNADSMLYHVPGSRSYNQTKAEVWFATEDDAEAAGFSKPPSQRDADTNDDTEDDS